MSSDQGNSEYCGNNTGDYYKDFDCQLPPGHDGEHAYTYTWENPCTEVNIKACLGTKGHEGLHWYWTGNRQDKFKW